MVTWNASARYTGVSRPNYEQKILFSAAIAYSLIHFDDRHVWIRFRVDLETNNLDRICKFNVVCCGVCKGAPSRLFLANDLRVEYGTCATSTSP
jgi:hypothetical protein